MSSGPHGYELLHVDDRAAWREWLAALQASPQAARNFDAFTGAAKRTILRRLIDAKRPETRAKRIEETVRLAAENERAGPP